MCFYSRHTSKNKYSLFSSTSRQSQITGPKYLQDTLISKSYYNSRCVAHVIQYYTVWQFSPVYCVVFILRYNQINAIGIACNMGVESCRDLMKSWYRQWMENPGHNPWVQSSLSPFKFLVFWNFMFTQIWLSTLYSPSFWPGFIPTWKAQFTAEP